MLLLCNKIFRTYEMTPHVGNMPWVVVDYCQTIRKLIWQQCRIEHFYSDARDGLVSYKIPPKYAKSSFKINQVQKTEGDIWKCERLMHSCDFGHFTDCQKWLLKSQNISTTALALEEWQSCFLWWATLNTLFGEG